MEPDYTYAVKVQEFGTTIESPPLFFIIIVDLNNEQIRVGYRSFQVMIEELLISYQEITSCKGFISNKPCFKVIQHGQFYGQLAVQSSKLSSYRLQFDKPCFRAFDSSQLDMQSELQSSLSRIYQVYNYQRTVIPVKMLIQGTQNDFQISIDETVRQLKQRLIDEFEIIRYEIPTNISLMANGFFMQDEESTMMSYRITQNMKITVVIIKKHGCLGSNTIILTKNGERSIRDLKVGDQIMSYNQKTMSIQVDKVTYVHQTVINSCIQIEMEEGTVIQATSNHFFLCEDNRYRKVDQERDSIMRLQVGSKLKQHNNKVGTVINIKSKYLDRGQIFYHICVQNNHNFICNQFITHNMFLNVTIPDNSTQKVNIKPNEPFSTIKDYFQSNFEIQSHNQRLHYLGSELKDHETMTDKNIPKQSKIYLTFKSADQFNFLHPLTPIITQKGQQIPIQDIKEGQYVLTYDCLNKCTFAQGDLVVSIVKKEQKEKMVIKLDTYEQEIVLSPDCYLQLQNGQAMNIMDLCYNYEHGTWPRLRKIDGSTYIIKEIAHDCMKPTFFYKLIIPQSTNYVPKSLILHNQIINILIKKNNIKHRKISLGVDSNDKIGTIKKRLCQIIGIPSKQIQFSFDNQTLLNQLSIASYNIRSQNIITANPLQKVSKSSFLISKIKHVKQKNEEVYLQLSQNQKIKLIYKNYKDKTVQEIMSEVIPNYKSSYFFIFLNIIILPLEPLKKIEESKDEFGENVIVVVRNDKLAFIQTMDIKPSQIKSYIHKSKKASNKQIQKNQNKLNRSRILVHRQQKVSNKFQQASNRIQKDKSITVNDFKEQQFYLPFLYLTSKQYSTRIQERIRNFYKYKSQIHQDDSTYSIIRDLYVNMNMLNNYYGKCYFGMKNFKCSSFFKEKNTFYWHSFIITHLKDTQIIKEIKPQNGTLFIIDSLNGKQVKQFSLYPQKQEILFAPFTYFMIQRIQIKQFFEIVWVSQISSPITFKKNIVLWVDDQPTNNKELIKKILSQHDIEILQVTSTQLAQKWVYQFGWLLKWKGLQFKLISDMTREENGNKNNEAGVDLLERLYKDHGITAQTLIYCTNRVNAQNQIRARNIPRERFYSITVEPQQVLQFCQMNNNQEVI